MRPIGVIKGYPGNVHAEYAVAVDINLVLVIIGWQLWLCKHTKIITEEYRHSDKDKLICMELIA